MNKIRLGFFSFTEITDPGEHHSYNEWHQLDHMPEQMPLDGIVYGQRWVRSPACVAATARAEPPFDLVHYLTMYLMADPINATLDSFFALGRDLARKNRFFQARTSHFAHPLKVTATKASPRILVSDEAIPYRPHRGIYVIVEGSGYDPQSNEAERAWFEHTADTAGIWEFATSTEFEGRRPTSSGYTVTVIWIDGDVFAAAANLSNQLDAVITSQSSLLFAGPFEVITPWQWNWFE